ncbi:hypothetical protein [Empedobacter brevis]|uniref:hypothetical protein n=1 Tax=Empedobacter brevis TaxID=247 RepID=UPI00289B67DC|nr:hypothetical protein [Empedobacter brevis]
MKIIKFLIAFFLSIIYSMALYAQEDIADYKQFEVLAKKINDIQRTADGNTVKNNETDVLLNIPETNFLFNYHNQSATTISKVDKEALLIHENIDLADVNHIGIHDESFGSCGIITIATNKKQNFTVVVDGKKENHEIESIAFYFPFSERAKGNQMYNALAELILLSKVKKGILTENNVNQLQKKWKAVELKNTAEDYYQFWNNEPDNIFTDLAYYRFEQREKSLNIDKLLTGTYHLGMTKKQFEDIVYNQLKQVQSEDKIWKEAVEKYRIPYQINEKGLTELHYFGLSNATTGIRYGKLQKIEDFANAVFARIEQTGSPNDLESLLPKGGKLSLFNRGGIRFNQKEEAVVVVFSYENESKDANSIKTEILKKFGQYFGDPKYIDSVNTYFAYFSKYTKRSIDLFFASSGRVLITFTLK